MFIMIGYELDIWGIWVHFMAGRRGFLLRDFRFLHRWCWGLWASRILHCVVGNLNYMLHSVTSSDFLCCSVSMLPLALNQPWVQWVLGALSVGVKCPGQALSPEVKCPSCDADHSPPSSAKVKDVCSCTSAPPNAFYILVLN
jgi:hypothetical protein